MTNYRTLSKRSNIVIELVSIEDARECVKDNYAVYSLNYSISNNRFCPTITLLKREPKGSKEGKTIYGVASKLPKSAREKIKPISISDFPCYKQSTIVTPIVNTIHSGLEEFISLMEELSKEQNVSVEQNNSVEQNVPVKQPKETVKSPTIKLDHEVLKSLYSLAKHLTYNDWLTLTQSLAEK